MINLTRSHFAIVTVFTLTALSANAALMSQYGILNLSANGGINPNTGLAWQAGDKYRVAFVTDGKINAESNDTSVYDNFATVQANLNGSITNSTGWTALVYVNTDPTQPQGNSVSNPFTRAGLSDITGGNGIGGAGVPVYAMDGMTAIARNNADIRDGWSNPFNSSTTIRLASGTTNNNSNGDAVVASQNVHYSPFLNQFGLGDSANIHGFDVWTGGTSTVHVNALGNIDGTLPADQTSSLGSSNANRSDRVYNRSTFTNASTAPVYAISGELTITDVVPEPSTAALLALGGLALLRRRR